MKSNKVIHDWHATIVGVLLAINVCMSTPWRHLCETFQNFQQPASRPHRFLRWLPSCSTYRNIARLGDVWVITTHTSNTRTSNSKYLCVCLPGERQRLSPCQHSVVLVISDDDQQTQARLMTSSHESSWLRRRASSSCIRVHCTQEWQ